MEGGSVIEFTKIALLKSQATKLCLYVNGQRVWSAPIVGEKILRIVDEAGTPLKASFTYSALVELEENCGKVGQGTKVGNFEIPAAGVFKDGVFFETNKGAEYTIYYTIFPYC